MFDLQTNVRDIVHVDQSEYKIVLLGDTIMSCRSIHLCLDLQLTILKMKVRINIKDFLRFTHSYKLYTEKVMEQC